MDQIFAEENVDNRADETVQWTLTDHLNTVRDIAKYDSGSDMTTVVNHLIYDAFGRVTSETNPTIDSLFLFTGRPFDSDTQLQNNLHRWYDATVGRWLSEDPIGFAGGDGNLYRYVGNVTQSRVDPLGLQIAIELPPPRPKPGWWPDWLFWPYDEEGQRKCFESFDPSDLVCPIAGVTRKKALETISGLSRRIEEHFAKIADERAGAPVINHCKKRGRGMDKTNREDVAVCGKENGEGNGTSNQALERTTRKNRHGEKSMSRKQKLEALLARAFEIGEDGKEDADFRKKQADFVFHMTDWLSDLETLYNLVRNPEAWDAEQTRDFLIGFLIHVIPHLTTAGKLLVGEIPNPFDDSATEF
ncbi:RHS repeat domain-containing protein [Thermogutta terrifontis]|uniref:RHS repeat domain-containing protein n=1 Tax=Thermogutta terrifontis TaxID=1331910 RepID=UPI0012FD70A0|nr:RHS repeat-associated core domain-containing protein [Thermogutta terrifontis]